MIPSKKRRPPPTGGEIDKRSTSRSTKYSSSSSSCCNIEWIRQNDQTRFVTHAGGSCFHFCRALDITDRHGVWECVLYLLNMFHNHGIDHLTISHILMVSLCLHDRRNHNVQQKITAWTTYNYRNHHHGLLQQEKEITTRKRKERRLLLIIIWIFFSFLPSLIIWIFYFLSSFLLPCSWRRRKIHLPFLLPKNLPVVAAVVSPPPPPPSFPYPVSSLSRPPPLLPSYLLTDFQLVWSIFVSCWLAFTWLEDVKLPLNQWAEILRLVPVDDGPTVPERLLVQPGGIRQCFIQEILHFWKDLDYVLVVSEHELNMKYKYVLLLPQQEGRR